MPQKLRYPPQADTRHDHTGPLAMPRRKSQELPVPVSPSGNHDNMTLDEAIRWTRANSHPEARSRLRSRSVAWILYMEILSLRNKVAQLETLHD